MSELFPCGPGKERGLFEPSSWVLKYLQPSSHVIQVFMGVHIHIEYGWIMSSTLRPIVSDLAPNRDTRDHQRIQVRCSYRLDCCAS